MGARFCPKCQCRKPMMRAGRAARKSGSKQLWKCRSKRCSYTTVNPDVGDSQ